VSEEIVGYIDPTGEGRGNWHEVTSRSCSCRRRHNIVRRYQAWPEPTPMSMWSVLWRFVLGISLLYLVVVSVIVAWGS
jgi:hypothetical protein